MNNDIDIFSSRSYSIFLLLNIIFMSIFLNQSHIILRVNSSFSDIFCFIILLYFISKKSLKIPLISILFFMIVSIFVIISSSFIVPQIYLFMPKIDKIIINYIKLIIILIYFLVGYNIARTKYIEYLFKYLSFTGLFVGSIGIIFIILNIKMFSGILYLEGRFTGLMNDPNYYSVIQVMNLAYFTRNKEIRLNFKIISILIIVSSIFITGSKTGFVTLMCYLFFLLVEYLFKHSNNKKGFIKKILILIFIIILFPILLSKIQIFIEYLSNIFPIFYRIKNIFINFNSAISEGGSNRDLTWSRAIVIIKSSPFFGIGIGTYSDVSMELFNSASIAHNTYLQLLAEWGIPLSLLFFIYIFLSVIKGYFLKNKISEINILIDSSIVLLIGSLGISLNNARVFWILLGILIYNLNKNKNYLNTGKEV